MKKLLPSDFWVGLLATAMVLNLFMLRPSALGEQYTIAGVGLAGGLFALFLFFSPAKYRPGGLPWQVRGTGVLYALYCLYESVLVIVGATGNTEFFLKEIATVAAILVFYGWPLSNATFNQVFFRRFCALIGVLGLSCGITAVMASFVGIEPLFLTRVDIKGYTSQDLETGLTSGAIYFPISMAYNRFTTDAVELFRFSGFFREAGIFQAFCCFAFAYEAFSYTRRWVMLGAIMGAVTAFSTIGLGMLIMAFGLVYALRRPGRLDGRAFGLLIFGGLTVVVVLFTPHIGLLAKASTHWTTVTDREEAVSKSLRLFFSNPIGTGPYTWHGQNAGINLLAQLGYIGLIGFVLQVILMSGWRFKGDRTSLRRIACCAPLMITAVGSQPLNGAPMMYVMVLCALPLLQASGGLWWRWRFRLGVRQDYSSDGVGQGRGMLGATAPKIQHSQQ